MDIFGRRSDDLQYWADEVVSLCAEHGFSHWMNCGRIFQGWAAVCRGEIDHGIQVLAAGIADWCGTGAQLWLPTFLALEAEAHAKLGRNESALRCIDRALAVTQETGERWAKAELLRIKARLLFESGKAAGDQIEGLLVHSLRIARRQRARCYELRAASDIVRMRQGQNWGDEAISQLRAVYNEFSEGFDTMDLQEAKALIQNGHGTSGTITVPMGTIDAMTTTNSESVIDTALATGITVQVGAMDMDSAAIGRMTTSKVTTNNEPPAST
jgi:predicted ATPase